MGMRIREAGLADLPALTDICLRSKAHWGYDAAFMAACRDELTLRAEDLAQARVLLAEEAGQPLAMAQLHLQADLAELDKLFVLPDAMGRGLGGALLNRVIDTARASGALRLECHADPFAEPFYVRAGFRRVGMVPSGTWPDRMLPRMSLML